MADERGNGDEGVGGKAADDSAKANGKPALPTAVELKSLGTEPSPMTDVDEAVMSVGENAKEDGDDGEIGRRVVAVENGVLGGWLFPVPVAVEAEEVMEPRPVLSLPIECNEFKSLLSVGGSNDELNWLFSSLDPLGSELMVEAAVPEDDDVSVRGNESKPDETAKSAVKGRLSWVKRLGAALTCGSLDGDEPIDPPADGAGNVRVDKAKLLPMSAVALGLEELRLGVRAVD